MQGGLVRMGGVAEATMARTALNASQPLPDSVPIVVKFADTAEDKARKVSPYYSWQYAGFGAVGDASCVRAVGLPMAFLLRHAAFKVEHGCVAACEAQTQLVCECIHRTNHAALHAEGSACGHTLALVRCSHPVILSCGYFACTSSDVWQDRPERHARGPGCC